MEPKNELQNQEYYLKGDLGAVKIGGNVHQVSQVFKGNDGATRVTINPPVKKIRMQGCNVDNGLERGIFRCPRIDNRKFDDLDYLEIIE